MTRGAVRAAAVVGLARALALGGPPSLSAQTLVGRVLEDGRERPVSGAVVSLLAPDGSERAQTLADSVGRFVLRPPEAGEYYLQAVRIGYETTRSPLLGLALEGQATLDLMMRPQAIGLEGLEVEVEATANEMLRPYGLSLEALGTRWIDRDDIEAVAVKRDPAHVIQWQNIPGISLPRPENMVPGSDDMGLCVSFRRGASGSGFQQCAVTVVDGQIVANTHAMDLDPDAIEGIAILGPVEATTLYGTTGGGGAVLIWTRRGRPGG